MCAVDYGKVVEGWCKWPFRVLAVETRAQKVFDLLYLGKKKDVLSTMIRQS